jgi:gas vesicle protein
MQRKVVHEWGRADMGDGVQDKARDAAGAAAEKGQDVADRAKSEASQVTDTAKDEARHVKDEVTTQARGLVDQAKTELRDQGRSQADHASEAIRRVGDQATALAEGRVEEAGAVADYARRAGNQVRQVADRLDRQGVEGVVNDVQDFARRRPATFLLGCAAVGFVFGRLVRGGAASSGDGAGGSDGSRGRSAQSSMYEPTV